VPTALSNECQPSCPGSLKRQVAAVSRCQTRRSVTPYWTHLRAKGFREVPGVDGMATSNHESAAVQFTAKELSDAFRDPDVAALERQLAEHRVQRVQVGGGHDLVHPGG
jgi:hypothetical protein